MNVPDYVSPVVAYRAWRLGPYGLTSLNGEFWHPNQKLQAVCRDSVNLHTPPHGDCSCGIYAAKSFDHLRAIGYAELGVRGEVVRGEVYLWGTVVEHTWGWRAQFAYPKTLVVGPEILLSARLHSLKILIGYGADLFVAGEKGNIPLWTKECRGFDHVREVAARLAQSRPSARLERFAAARQLLLRLGTWLWTSKPHNSGRQWESVQSQSWQPSAWRNDKLDNFAAAEAYAKEVYETHLRAIAAIASRDHRASDVVLGMLT
jgi:hypothetical protein